MIFRVEEVPKGLFYATDVLTCAEVIIRVSELLMSKGSYLYSMSLTYRCCIINGVSQYILVARS